MLCSVLCVLLMLLGVLLPLFPLPPLFPVPLSVPPLLLPELEFKRFYMKRLSGPKKSGNEAYYTSFSCSELKGPGGDSFL